MPLNDNFVIRKIFEDEFLFVIDKPPGIVVNRAESVKSLTVQDYAEKMIGWHSEQMTNDPFFQRSGIVHRLDKDTSGLLVIAKNKAIFEKMQMQFKERKIVKRYISLVHGKVVPDRGEIRASVGRLPWNRERFGIIAGGRQAVTEYRVLNFFSGNNEIYSYLEVSPHTGRTHQIRIHLKYINHPVVGDEFYAGRKTARNDQKFCPRLFLHAAYLSFSHPDNGKLIELHSELPDDLDNVLKNLKKI